MSDQAPRAAEQPIPLVKGTADVLPDAFARLDALQSLLLDRFARAGYRPIRVPVLENRELHERKSGARIVADLYGVSAGPGGAVCLRPEVTAGIVRAYNEAPGPPPLPWRVSYAGPVFRVLPTRPGVLREFHQVGVERLDDRRVLSVGDAEAIWLADWSLAEAGIPDAKVRIGHAGLIRDLLQQSGLPRGVQVALVDVLGDTAQGRDSSTPEDRILSAMEAHLDALAKWLGTNAQEVTVPAEDGGADRLFRTLYPEVVGRRTGRDIIGRMRRKWNLGHGLAAVLAKLREQLHELADLRGPALDVLLRLRPFDDGDSTMAFELLGLVNRLKDLGVDQDRIELDLGFGRGLGFYSQTVFVLMADTPAGPVEVCGGGRYDGLARALGSTHDVGGVGFAFGLERLRQVLDDRGAVGLGTVRDETLITASGFDAHGLAMRLRAGGKAAVVEVGDGPGVIDSARLRGFARVVSRDGVDVFLHDFGRGSVVPIANDDGLVRLLSGDRS